jgi:hypothetical protein
MHFSKIPAEKSNKAQVIKSIPVVLLTFQVYIGLEKARLKAFF